jgi:hypothetical protein
MSSRTASREDWDMYGRAVASLVERAEETMAGQYAQQVLTQHDNGDLRAQLFTKNAGKRSNEEVSGGPRHMTGD